MAQDNKLLNGLIQLKKQLLNLVEEAQKSEEKISDSIEKLKALSPIETTIERAIIKVENKGKAIPKQSVLKQTRS